MTPETPRPQTTRPTREKVQLAKERTEKWKAHLLGIGAAAKEYNDYYASMSIDDGLAFFDAYLALLDEHERLTAERDEARQEWQKWKDLFNAASRRTEENKWKK